VGQATPAPKRGLASGCRKLLNLEKSTRRPRQGEEQRIARPGHLAPVRRTLCFDTAGLSRAFRQSTGVPPHRWRLNERVERAKDLLRDPALSLADVALACGFGDQSHFTRMFTAAVRLSPGLWRRTQPRQLP